MEKLKSFFSPKTQRGREVRTWLQAMLGLSTILVGITVSSEFRDFLSGVGLLPQLGIISAVIASFSRIMHIATLLYDKIAEFFRDEKQEAADEVES